MKFIIEVDNKDIKTIKEKYKDNHEQKEDIDIIDIIENCLAREDIEIFFTIKKGK